MSDSHAKQMPRERIIPSNHLRLLNSVGQGIALGRGGQPTVLLLAVETNLETVPINVMIQYYSLTP